jgi:hypothetical protein
MDFDDQFVIMENLAMNNATIDELFSHIFIQLQSYTFSVEPILTPQSVIPITEKRVTKQDNQFEEFLSIVTTPPVIQYDTISTTNSIYKNAIAAACNANLPRTTTPKAQELDIYSSITEGMHHRYFRENQLSHTDMNNLQSFHQSISHEDPRVCVPADVQHTPNHFVKIEEDKHFPKLSPYYYTQGLQQYAFYSIKEKIARVFSNPHEVNKLCFEPKTNDKTHHVVETQYFWSMQKRHCQDGALLLLVNLYSGLLVYISN